MGDGVTDEAATRTAPLAALLRSAHRIAIDELHQRLATAGFDDVRFGHDCVFRFVDDDGSRPTTLAARSGHTRQAVGEVVSLLAESGYVERVADPADGRAKLVRLTERGRQAQEAGDRILADIEARWIERHGRQRIAALRGVLEDIVMS